MDSEGYLARFIDVDFKLPKPSDHSYCTYLFHHYDLEKSFRILFRGWESHGFIIFYSALASKLNLSLRGQEQYFARLNILVKVYNESALQENPLPIIIFLLILKFAKNDLYSKLLNPHLKWVDFEKESNFLFNESRVGGDGYNQWVEYIQQFFRVLLCSDEEIQKYKKDIDVYEAKQFSIFQNSNPKRIKKTIEEQIEFVSSNFDFFPEGQF